LRVLITGISGFVGRHLAAALNARGHGIWGLDRNLDAAPEGLHSVEWDLAGREGLAELLVQLRPEAVAHLAAQSSPSAALDDPEATFRANVTGTERLVEALRAVSPEARFLMISSSEVYGASDRPHFEDEAPAPIGPYGQSKAASERCALEAWRDWGLPAIVARSFPHSGPGQRPDFALPAFARQVARIEAGLQEPVLRVGNLEARRDWLHVSDVVEAYILLLEKADPGEIFNICSGKDHAVGEALDYLVGRSRVPARVEVDPDRLRRVDTPRLAGDAGKLRASLGWRPAHGFEALLDGLLDYWRERVNEEEMQ